MGVENLQQFGVSQDMSYSFAQGFLFASPVPAEEVTNTLLQKNTIDVSIYYKEYKGCGLSSTLADVTQDGSFFIGTSGLLTLSLWFGGILIIKESNFQEN